MRLASSTRTLLQRSAILALPLSVAAPIVVAQQQVPVRELSAPSASASITFRNVFSVREIADKKLLVNDGVQRRIVMLDGSLANPSVVLDSAADGGNSYGPRASPLIPYLADSSLFLDAPSLTLVVIDPKGKITRVMSVPRPNDLRFLAGSPSGVDAKGNLLYRVETNNKQLSLSLPNAGAATAVQQPQDSAPVSRANFERRSVDTVGYVRLDNGIRTTTTRTTEAIITHQLVNPLVRIDDWTVLSDGTIAFVRGNDYHVDLIYPDGRELSGEKLPFDWKRLTDADKQHLIDSARVAMKPLPSPNAQENKPVAAADGGRSEMAMVMAMAAMSKGEAQSGAASAPPRTLKVMPPTVEFVPLSEIGDYYPPIRPGAAKADADGNLWILPTTSAQSKAGELVYDVVDNRGALKERVRVPAGRSVAGFGKGGVVYLLYRDSANAWHLERTNVGRGSRQ